MMKSMTYDPIALQALHLPLSICNERNGNVHVLYRLGSS
jgi:hypothetical protein